MQVRLTCKRQKATKSREIAYLGCRKQNGYEVNVDIGHSPSGSAITVLHVGVNNQSLRYG